MFQVIIMKGVCLCTGQTRRDRSDKTELLQDVEPLDFNEDEPLETEERRSELHLTKYTIITSFTTLDDVTSSART